KNAGGNVSGATVYVTLEPCCHYGKTPPCANMLAEHNVSRVVAGMEDPNPIVNCKGLSFLRSRGIECVSGILESDCKWLNRGFIRRMKSSRPWVTIKSGISTDGNISLADGSSKWITNELSREKVHMLRAECDAVLTGAGTVCSDNPRLNVRDAEGRTPMRVLLDRKFLSPSDAAFFEGENIVIFTGQDAPTDKMDLMRSRGISVIQIKAQPQDEIDFVMEKLCEFGVNYLLVEAGSHLTSSVISSGCADEIALFAAPKILGGGIRFSEYVRAESIDKASALRDIRCEPVGTDLFIRGVFSCSPDL
ncbi:MAG: bifunctional diaminohydroxyphosphoribosylaminopyrimidine deaminase/5-amino-6-(5-phosphoribosylamino)uracil reductase RibD, partial [Synergistaceae bacterium]